MQNSEQWQPERTEHLERLYPDVGAPPIQPPIQPPVQSNRFFRNWKSQLDQQPTANEALKFLKNMLFVGAIAPAAAYVFSETMIVTGLTSKVFYGYSYPNMMCNHFFNNAGLNTSKALLGLYNLYNVDRLGSCLKYALVSVGALVERMKERVTVNQIFYGSAVVSGGFFTFGMDYMRKHHYEGLCEAGGYLYVACGIFGLIAIADKVREDFSCPPCNLCKK